MINPVFHVHMMNNKYFQVQTKQSRILCGVIDELVKKEGTAVTLDVKPLINNCAFDIICGKKQKNMI